MIRDAAVLVLALAIASLGVNGGDVAAADALWQHAVDESHGDHSHDLFIDAQRELARIRPWQPGYATARARMTQIGAARSQL
ncbi:MAG: hypothetical protein KC912_01060 [Proteobacteria bacterium]|nr:hypothetical protein [Pseudomonadota bacterium]